MHNPPHGPFTSTVLRRARTVKERSARADQHETSIVLVRGRGLSVLLDEVVHCQLGCVQGSGDIDVDNVEVGFLGRIFAGDVEYFVGTMDAGVGDDVGDFAGGGELGGGLEEVDLVGPVGCVALDECGAVLLVLE